MSTQHPDNARIPEWVNGKIIEGELEVIEALDMLQRDFGINKETIQMIKEDINYLEKQLGIKIGGNNYYERKHSFFSTLFLSALKENNSEEAKFYIKEMALIRKSIG
jgi:phosphoenolpyruvate carboxylase